ncbi:hypothetical protein RRG08_049978 [Elysia crispata]|uniref:Uncharacterized protein n=1 Tax=Elysia crispata TaxID=231223 RepID=A0AAE1B9E4_9GAST|nr:hypothetical protein RRG08_049978 [Elysia crispata]
MAELGSAFVSACVSSSFANYYEFALKENLGNDHLYPEPVLVFLREQSSNEISLCPPWLVSFYTCGITSNSSISNGERWGCVFWEFIIPLNSPRLEDRADCSEKILKAIWVVQFSQLPHYQNICWGRGLSFVFIRVSNQGRASSIRNNGVRAGGTKAEVRWAVETDWKGVDFGLRRS